MEEWQRHAALRVLHWPVRCKRTRSPPPPLPEALSRPHRTSLSALFRVSLHLEKRTDQIDFVRSEAGRNTDTLRREERRGEAPWIACVTDRSKTAAAAKKAMRACSSLSLPSNYTTVLFEYG